ncbi:MAG: hypothetical protein H6628_04905 [Calditrichae bacterium]|nr:hypothetical protein [Calditrichia bacterium]
MKTHILLGMAAVFVLLSLTSVSAAIITVDNKYPYAGDYQTLQAAHDAAVAGDTIFVYPSLEPYAGIAVTKQLVFLGVGFDITEVMGEPFTPTTLISGVMNFITGSQGSWLVGFDGQFGVTINANYINVKRNSLSYIYLDNGSGSAIIQNKISGRGDNIGYSSYYVIYATGTSSSLISNNIIINPYGSTNYDNAIGGISLSVIINNVIKAPAYSVSGTSNEVINNIIIHGYVSSNNLYRYNMSNSNQLPANNGNLLYVDMNSVFVDLTVQNFHLSPNSPAADTGENGTDMGIYGGDAPYVDGGFPGLPSILQILAPTVGSQQSGLNIQFKAKSNKE